MDYSGVYTMWQMLGVFLLCGFISIFFQGRRANVGLNALNMVLSGAVGVVVGLLAKQAGGLGAMFLFGALAGLIVLIVQRVMASGNVASIYTCDKNVGRIGGMLRSFAEDNKAGVSQLEGYHDPLSQFDDVADIEVVIEGGGMMGDWAVQVYVDGVDKESSSVVLAAMGDGRATRKNLSVAKKEALKDYLGLTFVEDTPFK